MRITNSELNGIPGAVLQVVEAELFRKHVAVNLSVDEEKLVSACANQKRQGLKKCLAGRLCTGGCEDMKAWSLCSFSEHCNTALDTLLGKKGVASGVASPVHEGKDMTGPSFHGRPAWNQNAKKQHFYLLLITLRHIGQLNKDPKPLSATA